MFKEILLALIMLASVVIDIKSRKIPNYLTFSAMIIGLCISLFAGGIVGLINSFYGLLTGFALLIVPYMLGGMGAGDVKLLMAVGAFLGAVLTFNVFLNGALIGGIYSIMLMAKHRELIPFLKKVYYVFFFFTASAARFRDLEVFNKEEKNLAIPYAVAIASGVVLSVWVRWF